MPKTAFARTRLKGERGGESRDDAEDGGDERERVPGRAHGEEPQRDRLLRERPVEGRPGLPLQPFEAAVRGDPHDRDPVVLAPALEALSHRVPPLPDEP